MRFTKSLLLAAIALICSIGMKAQDSECCPDAEQHGYRPHPYWFIQAQGGINSVFTDVPISKHLAPTFSIGAGWMGSSAVGVRLHVNGYKTTGAFDRIANPSSTVIAGQDIASDAYGWQIIGTPKKYSYNYITTDADLMLNVLNLFSKNTCRPFNFYLIGGLGLSYAWNNKEFEDVVNTYPVANDITNAWGPNQTPRQSLLSHNFRAGVLVDYNISKHFSVGAEVDMNNMSDRFNSKFNNSDDWMLTAQLSLTYKFGFKKPVAKVAEPERIAPSYTDEQQAVVATTDIEAPVAEADKEEAQVPLKETIFYAIRENTPNPEAILNRVVAWAKKYPNKKIEVSGYADKGTGNPQINLTYSQNRANSVCNELLKRGIPADQMIVNAYGDTVQPFEENDLNRCVIIIGGK